MKCLIVDCNIYPEYWGASDIMAYSYLLPQATFYIRRAPQEDLPAELTHWDAVIISGSATSVLEKKNWIDHLEKKLYPRIQNNQPTLGICFGHQLLARAWAGESFLRVSQQPEFGWTEVELIDSSPLFAGLKQKFYTFSAHYDEVCQVPPQFQVLAKSERCSIQALAKLNAPVFGVQFHPEKPLLEAKKTYQEQKKKGQHHKFLHPREDEKFHNPQVAIQIFKNFFETLQFRPI